MKNRNHSSPIASVFSESFYSYTGREFPGLVRKVLVWEDLLLLLFFNLLIYPSFPLFYLLSKTPFTSFADDTASSALSIHLGQQGIGLPLRYKYRKKRSTSFAKAGPRIGSATSRRGSSSRESVNNSMPSASSGGGGGVGGVHEDYEEDEDDDEEEEEEEE
jgi:hypothetical protein